VEIRDSWVKRGEEIGSPHITWFELPPDETRLDVAAEWISATEVVYPVKGERGKLARADVQTGKTAPCDACQATAVKAQAERAVLPGAVPKSVSKLPKLPEQAKQVAQSVDGAVSVYAVDTAEKLSLIMTRGGQIVTLFDNDRRADSTASRKAHASQQ
jgi:hypothetical protein